MLSVVLEILALLYLANVMYITAKTCRIQCSCPTAGPPCIASSQRFPLAVCVHGPAHAPKAEPWLYWSQWHSRAERGFHSTAFRFHMFSPVASPNYFFPAHLEHKVGHWIIATQSNLTTADFFQSVSTTTEFCTYWGASFQIYTQETTSHYVF